MPKDTITIRTTSDITGFLDENFKNKTFGAQIAVEAFIALRKTSLFEMKGLFTKDELIALVGAMVGLKVIVPEYLADKDTFISIIRKSQEINMNFSHHKVGVWNVIDKVSKLTSAQVFFLQCEIYCYLKKDISVKSDISELLL